MAAAEVRLTFDGVAAEDYVPADYLFAAEVTKAAVVTAHYSRQGLEVPAGVVLCLRPAPGAPDSALRVVTAATAGEMKRYLDSYGPAAVLVPRVPANFTAGAGAGAAGALVPAAEAPPAKRARLRLPDVDDSSPPAPAPSGGGAAELAAPAALKTPVSPAPKPRESAVKTEDASPAAAARAVDTATAAAAPAQLQLALAPARAVAPVPASALAPAPAPAPRRKRPADDAAAGGFAGGAGGSLAAPPGAAPTAVLMLRQKKYNSWLELLPDLRDGDTVIVRGTLQGPVVIKCARVTLQSIGANRFTILGPDGLTTLTLDADGVLIRDADIHATSWFDRKSMPSTVVVAQGRANCRLESCDIIGAGKKQTDKDGGSYGNDAVELQADTKGTVLVDVAIRNASGSSFVALERSTASLLRVEALSSGADGFWLRGAGKCRLERCLAHGVGLVGFDVEACDVCTLVNCRAEQCGTYGAVFGLSQACKLQALDDAKELLAHSAHDAKGLVCVGSGEHAVVFCRGVAADLTNASLCDSGLNAILVKGASLSGATARITLMGAQIRGSGKQPRASQAHSSAIAVELVGNKKNESRLAAITPGPPWAGVLLSENPGGACSDVMPR